MKTSKLLQKTLLGEILLFAIIAASTSIVSGLNLKKHMLEEFESKGKAIVNSIANSSVEVLFNRDASTLQSTIDQFLNIKGVGYIFVIDDRDEIIAHTFVPTIPPELLEHINEGHRKDTKNVIDEIHLLNRGEFIDISSPILAGVAGYVHVGMDKSAVAAHVKEATLQQLALVLAIFLLAVAIAYIRVNQISKPLNQLTEYAQRLKARDFSTSVKIQSKDEIGLLAQTLQSMSEELSHSFDNLEQAVSDATTELLVSNSYLRAILKNLADGLLVTDPQGRITQFNPALAEMFDLGKLDIRGQLCSEIFGRELAELATQTQQQSTEVLTAEIALARNRVGKAVSTAIEQELTMSGENDTEQMSSAILIRDITAEKEIDRMKTDFLSTVSHELRTPLTSVLGFTKLIKKKLEDTLFPNIDTGNKKQQRAVKQVSNNLNIIVAEGERLTTLINDVLDIAKMEAGRVDWKIEPIIIEELVNRSLAATSVLFQQKGLEPIIEIEPELPEIMGDKDRLIQVLVNLLSNAVKFTDEGSVTCRVGRNPESLTISVVDGGIGIAPEDCSQVFEKFKQVGDTLTDKPQGTGLGLPICKQIIEHHGGTIWVESTLGEGSTFSFSLPLSEIAEVPTINLDTLLTQLNHHVRPAALTDELQKKCILVVDDDAHIRELLRQELEAQGYQIREAKDGLEAIQQVKALQPDLIIMDVMMPQMSGFDAVAVLKNDPQTMEIPIVILSIMEDKERGYRLGVDRYLQKPINAEMLLQEISLLLSQGKSRRKVLLVDEDASAVRMLAQVLQERGYNVVEVLDSKELWVKAFSVQPDLIIANANLWQQSESVKTLRFEKGMENVLFILLADEHNDESDCS
ncbi:response regulator [Lusitaniella coriacea]|uniref:response regulator n=1 Tax=Lusitaniella coriacea TaxID=1983105 RepID=UPI003CF24C4A